MSRRVFVLGISFFALPLLLFAVPGARQKRWQSVQEAMNKGLPRTAIEWLEPIIAAAIKDKAYPEAIKAITSVTLLGGTPRISSTFFSSTMTSLFAAPVPVRKTFTPS